jgi:glycosyltransferase involved in cell wall biosynthesis
MKLLHLTSLVAGGAGRMLVDLAVDGRRRGHEIAVVASRIGPGGEENDAACLDALARHGVPVRLVDSTMGRDHARTVAVLSALDDLYPAGVEPALIHAHAAVPALIAMLFAGVRRRPMALLQTVHAGSLAKSPDDAATDLGLISRVDRVVAPTRYLSDFLIALGVAAGKVTVIPYGVGEDKTVLDEADEVTAYEMIRARRHGALVVVACVAGPPHAALVIDAIRRLGPGTPIHCVLLAEGKIGAGEHALVPPGAPVHVRIRGSSRAARRLAAGGDVLVLPSRTDLHPLTLLEAFCDRTLVIACDQPDLKDVIDPGVTGLTFPAGDAVGLAGALSRLATMPNAERRSIRKRAHAMYSARFTTAMMTRQYAELYERLVLPPARRSSRARRRISPAA